MLQEFRRRTSPETGPARLAALRAAMAEAGVDAFLVPRADAHRGDNVAPRDERLAWLTSFTGSAGLAVVTRDRAVVFVDGRYRLQVRSEVDLDAFEVRRHPEDKPGDWLIEALPGMILSIEPGYYREGGFGIRCENLGAVMPPSVPEGGDRPMLGFETLTLAPFDRRLIDPTLLDAGERAWLDG